MIEIVADVIYCDLTNRGYPVSVAFEGELVRGCDRLSTHVDVRRSRAKSDGYGPVRHPQRNDPKVAERVLYADVTIEHDSNLDGATAAETHASGELIVDAVISAIIEWTRSSGAGFPEFVGGNVDPERSPGRSGSAYAYVFSFGISRSVLRAKYSGAKGPTATIAEVEQVEPPTVERV